MGSIVSNSQTGFIKGRYIWGNVKLILKVIECLKEHEEPGLLFFADFEKVFDSRDHYYIIKSLKYFDFVNLS